MKTKITTVLAASMLLFACTNSTNNDSKVKTEKTSEEEADHHHDHESDEIALNHGEKWKVDKDMMLHIQNMEKDVNSFNGKSKTEYAALALKIKNNLDLLTSNCTMTGQAHDELHKWLLPFLDLADEFSESKSEEESAKLFTKVKTSFVTFNNYFQ